MEHEKDTMMVLSSTERYIERDDRGAPDKTDKEEDPDEIDE